MDRTELIESWIKLHQQEFDSEEYYQHFWAFEELSALIEQSPEESLSVILMILQRDNSSLIMQNLAAGPLEDLLVAHGSYVIGAVEALARSNSHFRKLLGGVWKNEIADDVWQRVERTREDAW